MAKKVMILASDPMVIRNPYAILGLAILPVFVFVTIAVNKMQQAHDNSNIPSLKQITKSLLFKNKFTLGILPQVLYLAAQIIFCIYTYEYEEILDISSEVAANYQFVTLLCSWLAGSQVLMGCGSSPSENGLCVPKEKF
ncbi:hypothetical protein [Flagellimonas marina]|uniref:Uncharacterized protein n=1 Tax=Flagellimonas marina TaxID=1775168 RepID=A0ABV8PN92_9FLAO